jgi:hypothetical protein
VTPLMGLSVVGHSDSWRQRRRVAAVENPGGEAGGRMGHVIQWWGSRLVAGRPISAGGGDGALS